MRSTVSVAARFAVYDDMMMSVKKNQKPPSTRPGSDLRTRTEPNHIECASARGYGLWIRYLNRPLYYNTVQ